MLPRLLVAVVAAAAAQHADLDRDIVKQMATDKIPGLSVVVLRDDTVLWKNAYGTTMPGKSAAPLVTNDTIFHFASISKTNIGVAAMLLYEKELLNPNDDIDTYVNFNFSIRNPAFPKVVVTLHSLLTHSSSISDDSYGDIPIYMPTDPTISLHDFLYGVLSPDGVWGKHGGSWHKKFGPNRKYDYSNVGACLMAYVCELVAKKHGLARSFDELVRKHIHVPLGADPAEGGYFIHDFPPDSLKPPAYAMPSMLTKDGWLSCGLYSVPDYPTCDWRQSAFSYARMFGMVMNFGKWQGKQLLSVSTVEYMRNRSGFLGPFDTHIEGTSNSLFLWQKDMLPGYDWLLGHDGSDEGIRTYAYFNPITNVGFIALSNGDDLWEGDVDGGLKRIGSMLMKVFDTAHPNSGHNQTMGAWVSQARARTRRTSPPVGGYPGSSHAPGCRKEPDDSFLFV